MASVSPGGAGALAANLDPQGQGHQSLFGSAGVLPGPGRMGGGGGGSGYYVSTSDGASTCSSSTTEPGEADSLGVSGGTLLVLEPKSLRSFETNDEYLYAMQEDLADWFSCLYQADVTADNFFQALETGVLLCRHANKVQENARQMRERGETLEMRSYFIRSVPERNVQYRENVKPETFQARDNISNFISWGRQLGIPEVLSFETDDLVLRKNEKSVILCLLELARVGAKLGMLAPTLVQMEEEIDAELAGEEPKPQVQVKTCDMRSLDERVRDLIGRCTCPIQFPMIKVGDGKYKIGDSRSLIFVRILRNHVMVRVGGGWDTLENYLNKHDPCQCNYRGHRAGTAQAAHKTQANQSQQQRRASMPGGNASHHLPSGGGGAPSSVINTPTSPRRMSSVAAPFRHRSVSPQNQHATQGSQSTASANTSSSGTPAKQNPPRSKSPTLIISRHTPSAAGGGGANKTRGGASVSNSFSSNASANSNFSVSRVSTNQSSRGEREGVVSKSWSQPLNRPASTSASSSNNTISNTSNKSYADSAPSFPSQPMRSKSPSPGRLRSPSPLSVAKSPQQAAPAPLTRTVAGSKGKGQGQRVVTPRKLPGSSMLSDNEGDDIEDNNDYDQQLKGVDDDSDENEIRERPVDIIDAPYTGHSTAGYMSDSGSVSFDERAEWNCDERSSSSSLEKVCEHADTSDRSPGNRTEGGGGGTRDNGRVRREEENMEEKSSVSMDKISTMTLSEFRSLLNSNLSVPDTHLSDSQTDRATASAARSPAGSSDSGQHQASWDSLREKARSVRDSISNTVSNRRPAAGATAIGRRSLPQSPDGSSPASSFERPKTPQALRRNRNSSTGRTSPVSRPKTPTSSSSAARPKTPTSGISRPKTPTSGIARPKTPTSAPPREEYRMSRPKTPSQVKRDAVAKVAGAISNWVDSRPDVAPFDRSSSASRPKTPTSRPKTPTKPQARWDGGEDGDADVDDDFDDEEDNAEISGYQTTTRAVPAAPRDRPSTPSRIPKPSFLPRPTTPKVSSDSTGPVSRERPHTSLGTSSTLSLSSQEEEILQRQQQLQRLQKELEEAQRRMDEDRRKQQQQQQQQSPATRPNFLPTNSLSRSNSNASSEAVQSPSSTINSSGPKSKIAASRRLPLPRGSSEDGGSASRSYRDVHTARRCVTPGPGTGEMRAQPSRAVTPGPRERWALGGSGGAGKSSQQRRGSLNTGAVTERDSTTWCTPSNHNSSAKYSNGATSNNQYVNGDIPFTNEITFSDDEEINELVRNAALMNGAQLANQQASDSGRVRSASVDARRLERQATRRNSKGGEEVLVIRRDSSGGHAVELPGPAGKDKPQPKSIVRRPQKPQGSGIVKSSTSTTAASARFRSQTPDPSMFRQKLTTPGQRPGGVARPTTPSADSHSRAGKPQNRTEAWVDSTLSDPKRKLPTKPRRARGGVAGEITASELTPRPLEEIQAMLSTPRDGAASAAVVDPAGLEAPPEDPEMFRKMEKLFEKYREMELRASVNETPGGPPVNGSTPSKSSSEIQSSSGRPGSLKSSGGAVSSGKQSLSIRTSSSGSGGASGSTSLRVSPMRQSSVTSNSVDLSRYQRASSAPQQERESVSAINSPSTDLREFSSGTGASARDRHRAVPPGEADQKGLQGSLRDIDPETAKNPAALITKIKEILKVRPRRDENAQVVKTRIPAPASLTRSSRSKSVSNLCSDSGHSGHLSASRRGVLKHSSPSNAGQAQQGQLNRANSGSSGNISYSEFVFNDEEESADNVPELSKAWSVKSDSSDSQTRSETPVPKLATPLTTGRSTLIGRMGRSLSQDKENSLSTSQTSLSGRSTFSATEEDADYV